MDTFEVFLKLRATETGCLVWTNALTAGGYGVARVDGRNQYIHRLLYELEKGPIGDALTIDHLCRNRACANVDHLEAVTHTENVLRGISPMAENARKDRCKRGHLFNEENTLIHTRRKGARVGKTERICLICKGLRYTYVRKGGQ